MTHPLKTSSTRRLFERMNAPQMFRDNLLGWFLAALAALGLVVAVSTILAIRVPL